MSWHKNLIYALFTLLEGKCDFYLKLEIEWKLRPRSIGYLKRGWITLENIFKIF